MPYYRSFDEVETKLRNDCSTGENIIDVLKDVFSIWDGLITNFERNMDALEAYRNSEMTVLDKYDFALKANRLALYDLDMSEEEKEILQNRVSGGELQKHFQEKGDAFFKAFCDVDVASLPAKKDALEMLDKVKKDVSEKLTNNVASILRESGLQTYDDIPGYETLSQEMRATLIQGDSKTYEAKWRQRESLVHQRAREVATSEQAEDLERMLSLVESYTEESERAKKEIEDAENAVYLGIMVGLMEHSPITQEEAEQWAISTTDFTDKALGRLKRAGYPKEQLLKDLAELYRLVGGKLGPIVFQTDNTYGSKRASSDGKTAINVTTNFTKRTLFHEAGHVIEGADPAVLAASKAFIRARATGEPEKLRKLTGIKSYRADEIAYPDHFISPYVGKIYSHDASEVFSMSIERLSSSEKVRELSIKDPEHLKLLLGELVSVRGNTMKAITAKTQAFIEKKKEVEAQRAKLADWEKLIDKVAGPELEKLLLKDEGFAGYKLYRDYTGSKKGSLYEIRENGVSNSLLWGNIKELRRMAYFMIARDKRLLPDEYNPWGNGVWPTYPHQQPEWFDPEKGLPPLPETQDAGKLAGQWRKARNKVITEELTALLQREEGFNQYRLPERSTSLEHWNGTRWESLYTGTSLYSTVKKNNKINTAYAYFAIANSRAILPSTSPLTKEDICKLADPKADAPEWFEGKLPEVW